MSEMLTKKRCYNMFCNGSTSGISVKSYDEIHYKIVDKLCEKLESFKSQNGLICRESQLQILFSTYKKIVNATAKASEYVIYIRGRPGTGKTHTVLHFLLSLQKLHNNTEFCKRNAEQHIINGAMVHNAADLFKAVCSLIVSESQTKELVKTCKKLGVLKAFALLKEFKNKFSSNEFFPVVIDEEDQLIYKENNKKKGHQLKALLSLFKTYSSSLDLMLILISNSANAEELADTQIKHNSLHKKLNFIIFPPYTENELRQILDQRIQTAKETIVTEELPEYADAISKFDPFGSATKTLLLKKIAAYDGDCRQLLHTYKYLILHNPNCLALNEKNQSYQALLKHNSISNNDISRHQDSNSSESTITQSPPIPVYDSTYHSNLKILVDFLGQTKRTKKNWSKTIQSLPLHQQIVLCVLCIMTKENKCPISVRSVQVMYRTLCKKYKIPEMYDSVSFIDALNHLYTMGVVRLGASKRQNVLQKRQISNQASIIELSFDLENVCQILKSLKKLYNVWLN